MSLKQKVWDLINVLKTTPYSLLEVCWIGMIHVGMTNSTLRNLRLHTKKVS